MEKLIEEGKAELEKVETLDTLVYKEVVTETKKHEAIVYVKAPSREYCESFTRFSIPCSVEGHGALDYGDYGRIMVRDVKVKIHGFDFLVDFVVLEYGDEGEPSVMFGRNFLVATKCQVDFGLGEMRIDITMLKEDRGVDSLLATLVEDMLDEVLLRRSRLENKDFREEDKERIIEHGLPKKLGDPSNFTFPVRVNGTTQLSALADTGASVSVMPYSLYKNLGLCNPHPYHSNLTMLDNTQAKAMGEVRNVRLGRPFLRTCGALIDMRRGTMTIDDRVIKHTYYPKPRVKVPLNNLDMDEDEDWLGWFEVGRVEDRNPKFGHSLYKKIEEMAFGMPSSRFQHRVEGSSLGDKRKISSHGGRATDFHSGAFLMQPQTSLGEHECSSVKSDSDENAEYTLSKLLQMGTVAEYEIIAKPNELNIAVQVQDIEETTLHTLNKVEVVSTSMVATYEEHGCQDGFCIVATYEEHGCQKPVTTRSPAGKKSDLGAITSKGGPPDHMRASEKELAVLKSPLKQKSMFKRQNRMLRRKEQQRLSKDAKIQRRIWDPGIKSLHDNTLRARWF
nr:hypothetical protein [Tanacetum cinerariifolium]